MVKKWFRYKRGLGGWSKDQPQEERLRRAYFSRPKNWSEPRKLRSVGQALTALANVTQDKETREKARNDARKAFTFLRQYNKKHKK